MGCARSKAAVSRHRPAHEASELQNRSQSVPSPSETSIRNAAASDESDLVAVHPTGDAVPESEVVEVSSVPNAVAEVHPKANVDMIEAVALPNVMAEAHADVIEAPSGPSDACSEVIEVIVRLMSGSEARVGGLERTQSLGLLLARAREAHRVTTQDVSLVVGGQRLGPAEARQTLQSLGITDGAELLLVLGKIHIRWAGCSLEDFELGACISESLSGSLRRMRFATHKPSGTACTVIVRQKFELLKSQNVSVAIREKEALEAIDHPFVVHMYGTFHDPRFLYLAQEHLPGGEFFSHLRKAQKLPEGSARVYIGMILLALEHIHGLGYIYRNLKPESLLMGSNGYLKLVDFSFTKHVGCDRTFSTLGTPEYFAPEFLLRSGHSMPADWWALGVLTYEMLTGQPPFCDEDPMGIYHKIIAGKVYFPSYMSGDAKAIVEGSLNDTQEARWSAAEYRQSPFFEGFDFTGLLEGAVIAPIVPSVSSPSDTSQYEVLPDSVEVPQEVTDDLFAAC